ncbi:MAG: TrkH family potassium uptake protein [Eubacteriales bacterium]|jgi:trk system potassium uptake protein TrkH
MNVRMVISALGKALKIEAALMLFPLMVALLYGEPSWSAFAITIVIVLLVGILADLKKPENRVIREREGFVIVGCAWILLSAFGAIPFVISGQIPSCIDAFFEVVSGFTTTGSSILKDVELLDRSLLFWRSFTNWIGGMGVLVFVLAVLPLSEGRSIHIMRAESPGPIVGKLVSKMRSNAMILYGIYIVLSIMLTVFLLAGGMPLFDSVVNTFATAGTGGFSIKTLSIAAYNSAYIEGVITVFMLLFSINFNVYYLIITGHVIQALKSEELRWFLGIVASAMVAITICNLPIYDTVLNSFRYATFQVSTIISTTGFATDNFDVWPTFSKSVLMILMFLGASAGSTGGGIKTARIIIMLKSIGREIRRMLHPRSVAVVKLEGKTVDQKVIHGTSVYLMAYMGILLMSVLLISINGFDMVTTITSVITCLNNIGPGFGMIGPNGNFAEFSNFSKLILSLNMLIGRLEIFPVLMLFSPAVWRRR